MGKIMVIDTSKCIGCKACQIACQQWHKLPAEDTSFTGSYQNPPDMSSASLTIVKFHEVGNNGDLRWLFFKDQCRHCKFPFCVDNCPLGAIKITAKGFVIIKAPKCKPTKKNPADVVGVDYCSNDPIKPCQYACPFKTKPPALPLEKVGVPRYKLNNGSTFGEGKAIKCDFCYDRWEENLVWGPNPLKGSPYKGYFARSDRPACQVACPTDAITTGAGGIKRPEADNRVAFLKANGYPNANVYPKAYPTKVIWVLLESPEVYGLDPF
jgi:formate dehydrogenase iron-sulfur subunit